MKKRPKILLATLAMVFLAVLIGVYAYLSDYYHANDLAIEAMAVQEDGVPVEQDGVLNRDSYEKNRKNLPADFTEVVIDGGCHAQFGSYGVQKGDGIPTISDEDTIQQTATCISNFIDSPS
mgnify:CR=1 FL=1